MQQHFGEFWDRRRPGGNQQDQGAGLQGAGGQAAAGESGYEPNSTGMIADLAQFTEEELVRLVVQGERYSRTGETFTDAEFKRMQFLKWLHDSGAMPETLK